jgi:hypothetical protein
MATTLPAAHSFPHTMPQAMSDLIQQAASHTLTAMGMPA